MPDESTMRWMVMLNQARAFAEHDPHGALGRVDEVLREIDAYVGDPETVRDLRDRARALRISFEEAYERFQAAAAQRSVAYRARIQREISGPGHD